MNKDRLKSEAEEVHFWGSIDKAVRKLAKYKSQNKNVYLTCRGKKLYSLFDDENSCYMSIFGKTKSEYLREKNLGKKREKKRNRAKKNNVI